MELQEAMKKVKADKALAKRFTEDPKPVLEELGVDTSAVKITPVDLGELSEDDLERVAGGGKLDVLDLCIEVGILNGWCSSIGI